MRRRERQFDDRESAGFTILELVLVMVLITVTLAIAAPSLRGFWAGARVKNEANQICALAMWARTQAITQGATYRLNIDANGKSYSVSMVDSQQQQSQNSSQGAMPGAGQQQQQATPISSEFGQTFQVADNMNVSLVRDDGGAGDHVDFFPNGRAETGTIHVSSGSDDVQIACLSPTERYAIVQPGVGR